MRYITKEWYDICQQTGIHFGMRAHKGTGQKDEDLYLHLYKRKEREFVKIEREISIHDRLLMKINAELNSMLDKSIFRRVFFDFFTFI